MNLVTNSHLLPSALQQALLTALYSSLMGKREEFEELIDKITSIHEADLLVCNSGMDRGVEVRIVDMARSRKRRKNLVLFLTTSGGDADVAFRIARFLQCTYSKFICVIPGWCKSAGTLLSLGANEVVFGVHGELGPLDVQMAKRDDLLDSESGLTVMDALTAIHEKTLLAFEHFFIETTIKGGGRLSVQTASEIAVGLATGLFAPISQQIDPIHIGEAYRSMAIATEYGQRLIEKNKNTNEKGLNKIITGYPSHGFVIDRLEAKTVFEHVRECSEDEQRLIDNFGKLILRPVGKPWIAFLNDEPKEPENETGTEDAKNDGTEGTSPQPGGDTTPNESAAETGAAETGGEGV